MPYRDLEQRRAYGREWIKRNPERAREAMRRWRRAHPDLHNAESRQFYARHKDRKNAAIAAYHLANPAVRQTSWERRRGRLLNASGTYSTEEWLTLVANYGGRCGYCGLEASLEADHRIPLARGGSNSIENIIPACSSCNRRKHMLTEPEFRARLAAEKRRAAAGYDFSRVLIM
jgi:5-methylcytosine-specific restriction endonuclease McrA